MMNNNLFKNIFIIGAPRTGKTSLAKRIVKEKHYNLISIDDLVSGFKNMSNFDVYVEGKADATAKNIEPFMEKLFEELSEGTIFYDGIKTVVEGTYVDFEKLIPFLRSKKLENKYYIIGLTYNNLTENDVYDNIKKYDTEDDWTYWCNDEELKGNVKYFIDRNKYFNEKFKQYNIETYDTSFNREKVIAEIINKLNEKCKYGQKKSN